MQPRAEHTRPSAPLGFEGAGSFPGRVPLMARLLDVHSTRTPEGFAGTDRRLGLGRLALEHHTDPFEHVLGDLVAPALGAHDRPQAALEVRMSHAGAAGDQVLLDVHADAAFELTVEVELEAPQDFLAINR